MLGNAFTVQLPAWTSAVFTAVGMVLMALYHHILDRRSKRIDHELQKQTIVFEQQLAFVQERHTKRVDALEKLGHFLMEFDHSVKHIKKGGVSYIETLHDFYGKARSLGRETEPLVGPAVYQAVIACTDEGRKILDANFVVTERTVAIARIRELPGDRLADLEVLVGTKHPVREGGDSIFRGYDGEPFNAWRLSILGTCELSEEFSEDSYNAAYVAFDKAGDEITRTLPVPPAYPSG